MAGEKSWKKIKSDMEQKAIQLAAIDKKVFCVYKRNKTVWKQDSTKAYAQIGSFSLQTLWENMNYESIAKCPSFEKKEKCI